MNADTAQSLAVARIRECASVMQSLLDSSGYLSAVVEVADAMTKCLRSGNKILFFGNGGSAADAQHLAAELSGRFLRERASLSGWALTTNSSVLTVATEPDEREEVEVEHVGGVHESAVFELPDGRVAVRAVIAVTNHTKRAIDVIELALQTPWGDSQWEWLKPIRVSFRGRHKRKNSYEAYQFPGRCGLQLPRNEVINHLLLERRRLPSRRRLEGWLLGIGGRMPAELHHGHWLDLSLAIIGFDQTKYATTIQLWAERLEARPKTVTPQTSLLEREVLPPREVVPTALRAASQSGSDARSAWENR